jgi:acetyl esterase/lipase
MIVLTRMARHSMFRTLAVSAILIALAPVFTTAIAAQLSYTDLLARQRPVATKRIPYGTAPSQFGELWLPSGSGPHRVVVLIHGGCWRADLPGLELMAYAAEDLRQHGIAVWSIEHRRLGEPGGGYPGTFEDIASAIDWLSSFQKPIRWISAMWWRWATPRAAILHYGPPRDRVCQRPVRFIAKIRLP